MNISLQEFEAGTFDVASFDHEAHVYVGWLLLQTCSLSESISRYSQALRTLTARLGLEGKYHETITWFFLIIIAQRRTGKAASNWPDFKRNNPDLIRNGGALLKKYYSPSLLQSDHARKAFVLPDIGIAA